MTEPADPGHTARADQAQAEREAEARHHLLQRGARELPSRPWRPAPLPPSAVDLVHFALGGGQPHPDDLLAALTLLPAARAELDELESGLLFTARRRGLTWARMADAMGLSSPQACQQRLGRLTARRDNGR